MKVLFIVDIVTDYRVTFFEKLNNSLSGELLVVNSSNDVNDGRPATARPLDFQNIHLRKKKIKVLGVSLYYYEGLFGVLNEFKPDKVVIPGEVARLSNWLIMFFSMFYNYKITIWACHWLSNKGLKLKLKKLCYKIIYSFADKVITYSSKAKREIDALINTTEKTSVCHNALDNDLIELQRDNNLLFEKTLLNKKGNKSILLYVGALREDKNVKALINAYRNANLIKGSFELWIVGDGPEMERIRSLCEGSEDVVLWGREVEKANCFFSVADLFILPGIGGLALNQAMYWNTPCIVHSADGTEEDLIFDGVTGSFFDGTEYDLQLKIEAFFASPKEKREFLSNNSHQLVSDKINIDNMVKTFLLSLTDK
jgi:glycosyltransferase involved in cell wall biosynthesis